jgi:hypothetical protein
VFSYCPSNSNQRFITHKVLKLFADVGQGRPLNWGFVF